MHGYNHENHEDLYGMFTCITISSVAASLTHSFTSYAAYNNASKHTIQNWVYNCLPEEEPMRFETRRRRQKLKKSN